MPGNSQRRGAIRKNSKGATVGSGGQRRRGLEGKGPTPKAADREYHPAHKRATSAAKRSGGGAAGPGGRGQARSKSRGSKASSEMVYGRNSVLEALRADEIRDQLTAVGIEITDTQSGAQWSLARAPRSDPATDSAPPTDLPTAAPGAEKAQG